MNTLPLLSARKRSSTPREVTPAGPSFVLFNLGFQPFYLLAALSAAALLLLWLVQYALGASTGGYINGSAWHAHEMIFGFATAVITGFLFTATRN